MGAVCLLREVVQRCMGAACLLREVDQDGMDVRLMPDLPLGLVAEDKYGSRAD